MGWEGNRPLLLLLPWKQQTASPHPCPGRLTAPASPPRPGRGKLPGCPLSAGSETPRSRPRPPLLGGSTCGTPGRTGEKCQPGCGEADRLRARPGPRRWGRVNRGPLALTNSSACRRASGDEAQDPRSSARPAEPRRDAGAEHSDARPVLAPGPAARKGPLTASSGSGRGSGPGPGPGPREGAGPRAPTGAPGRRSPLQPAHPRDA